MDRPRRKRSEGKATWPGRKQVFRRYDAHGRIARALSPAAPFRAEVASGLRTLAASLDERYRGCAAVEGEAVRTLNTR